MIERETLEGEKQVKIPDLKLWNEVFSSIQSALGPKRAEELTPQDIFIPSILIPNDFSAAVLAEVGFPNGFPVIVVGNRDNVIKNEIVVSGSKRGWEVISIIVSLSLGNFLSDDRTNKDVILSYLSGNNPSLFADITRGSNKFMLGSVFKNEENILLLRIGESGIYSSSLTLPKGWESVVQDGKLIAKPEPEPAKTVEQTKTPEGVKMQKLNQGQLNTEDPRELFSEIKERLRNFPDGRLPNTQIAKFGKEGTSVEIQAEERKIVFSFANLDFQRFRELCRSRTLSLGTFADCFGKEHKGDRFLLSVALDAKNNLQVQGQIVRWDFVNSRLTNSLPYLGPCYPAYLEMIKGVISDKATLSYFLSQLKKPDNSSTKPKLW